MNNIVTITGFKTEGGDTFENVPNDKIKLIYEILNENVSEEKIIIAYEFLIGNENINNIGCIINRDKMYMWIPNKGHYLDWESGTDRSDKK